MTAEIDPHEALGHVAEGHRRAETREENDARAALRHPGAYNLG